MSIDISTPLRYAVGDKDVLPIRLTDWLGSEDVATVAVVSDSASLTAGSASVTTVPYTIKGKVTLAGDAVLVPFTVTNGTAAEARLLVTIQSSNASRKLVDRAIPIKIVG